MVFISIILYYNTILYFYLYVYLILYKDTGKYINNKKNIIINIMVTKKFNRYKKVNKNRNTKNRKLRNILKTKQKRGKVLLKNKKLTSKHVVFTNKYDKTGKSHKYIKMPEIDTSVIQSEYFLPPLKYIETDKQSIDTEKMVVKQVNFYDKIEKSEKSGEI